MRKQTTQIKTSTMASYGTGKFLGEFLTGAYGIMVYYFFEKELRLAPVFVTIATIIYSLWNAINDPLIGYVTGKKNRLSAKYGRRTPWIMIGLVLCCFAFLLIFAVPKTWIETRPLLIFIWMVLAVCLYDGCYSIWEVNYQGVFPDKFRLPEQRHKCAAVSTLIGVFGIALGAVLPPLFYTYGEPQSFLKAGIIICAIGLFGTFLIRRGVRETPEMIERYEKTLKESTEVQEGFFVQLKKSLKHREFLALVIMLFLYQSGCICMTGSVNYVVSGVLGMSSSATTPIFAGMLVGSLFSILIWKNVAKKIQRNNQKLLIITCIFMACAAFPMTFVKTQLGFAVFMFCWGLGFGGYWTFMTPAMADVVDSVVVQEKKRDDGILMGVRAFFMRLSYAMQAIVFWLCHTLTGYDAAIEGKQAPLAMFGINLHMATIPAVFFVLAAVIFAVLNPLTPEKVAQNKAKLEELNL